MKTEHPEIIKSLIIVGKAKEVARIINRYCEKFPGKTVEFVIKAYGKEDVILV